MENPSLPSHQHLLTLSWALALIFVLPSSPVAPSHLQHTSVLSPPDLHSVSLTHSSPQGHGEEQKRSEREEVAQVTTAAICLQHLTGQSQDAADHSSKI